MRSLAGSFSVVTIGLVILGCGGGAAPAAGASSPDNAAPAGTTMDAGAPKAMDSTAPTTTLALGDAGDLQGSKLVETHSSATTADPSAGTAKPPHGHDVGRSPQDIRAIIQAHRDEARACYDAALKDHPGIEGDLVIQWTIDPKGNVTAVTEDTSRSQIVEPTVVACVVKIIQGIQFAPSPGGFETKAFYPFNFHPKHSQS